MKQGIAGVAGWLRSREPCPCCRMRCAWASSRPSKGKSVLSSESLDKFSKLPSRPDDSRRGPFEGAAWGSAKFHNIQAYLHRQIWTKCRTVSTKRIRWPILRACANREREADGRFAQAGNQIGASSGPGPGADDGQVQAGS